MSDYYFFLAKLELHTSVTEVFPFVSIVLRILTEEKTNKQVNLSATQRVRNLSFLSKKVPLMSETRQQMPQFSVFKTRGFYVVDKITCAVIVISGVAPLNTLVHFSSLLFFSVCKST